MRRLSVIELLSLLDSTRTTSTGSVVATYRPA